LRGLAFTEWENYFEPMWMKVVLIGRYLQMFNGTESPIPPK